MSDPPPAATSAPHALIAGAGIGGLTAALCLARVGWQITLLERAPVLEEAGAGLQISPNASAILRDLGVLPRLKGGLAPEVLLVRRGQTGAILARMPLADAAARWGAPYLVAHRADLQRALLESVADEPRIRLMTGIGVAGFALQADTLKIAGTSGPIRLQFEADCMIGADGVRSFVRERLGFSGTPRRARARQTAWRTLIDASALDPAWRTPQSTLWLGAGAHLVTYPLRGGTVINVVAVLEETRPPQTASPDATWSAEGDPNVIARRFTGWNRQINALISKAPDWMTWPLVDLDPLPRWTQARIALLGDAAHPVLPFLAQGAAQAIEDAAALAHALPAGRAIEPGLRAYAASRQARAARVQLASRRQGGIYHLSDAAAFARDLALGLLGGARLLARYDWLYGSAATPREHPAFK